MSEERKREKFFACCKRYHEALKPSQSWLVGTSWASGCSWKMTLPHLHKLLPVGNIVLSAADGLHKNHLTQWSLEQKEQFLAQNGKIPFELGLRNEFSQDMTPAYALRLLAFFRMAEKSEDVKKAGFHIHFDWHHGINWQLNMCLPICAVNLDVEQKPGERYPADWEQAFHAVKQAMPIHVRVLQGLLDKTPPDDLVCTREVWQDLLGWYYSNKSGVDRRCDYQHLSEEVEQLIDMEISSLNLKNLPKELTFLQDSGDTPIGLVREFVISKENAFKQWLQQKVRNGEMVKTTAQNYLSALKILQQALQGELDLGVKSVFLLKTAQDVQKFLVNLKGSAWYSEKSTRSKGAAHGGTNFSAVMNQYSKFLNNQENANMTNDIEGKKDATTKLQPKKPEKLIMTLEALVGRQDRNVLLTGSKPVYLECPWGKLENSSWRSLYNAVWDMVWKEKSEEIVGHGGLLARKDSEEYFEKPQRYYSLDDSYAAYNNYGTCSLLPKMAKLFAVCRVSLKDVKVSFVTNGELPEISRTVVALNTILYGPPGTGKTYHTITYAVAICEGKTVAEVENEERSEVMKRYGALVDADRIAFATFHQSYEYGDFIEGLAPVVKGGSIAYEVKAGVFREFCEQVPDEPCVFIIDEINRGNISKILGELITLIEESKRGKLTVKLPVSGEEFTVPRNVYILGTMNTADRSLAMMDTALRRRFDFVRMDPQPELLPGDVNGVDVPMLLRTMNKRICWLYDAEHTLGHALFWGVRNDPTLENLGRIFRKKVIPLLMEYFHDDYAKVKQVLGNSSMMEEENLPADLFSRQEELDLLQAQYHPLPDADPRWEDAVTYTAIYM